METETKSKIDALTGPLLDQIDTVIVDLGSLGCLVPYKQWMFIQKARAKLNNARKSVIAIDLAVAGKGE